MSIIPACVATLMWLTVSYKYRDRRVFPYGNPIFYNCHALSYRFA